MKEQEPILVRANVTGNLRMIRKQIERLKEGPRTLDNLQEIRELQEAHETYKKRFIYLVCDNQ